MATVSQAIDSKRSYYTKVIILSYGEPGSHFNQTKKRLEEQGKIVHIVNISDPIYWPENLSIDEQTKVIILGHGGAGYEYITSNNGQRMHFTELAALINKHTTKEARKLILSQHSCHGGSDAPHTHSSNHESSFAAKLIRALKQTHRKNASVSARLGTFCEELRSVNIEGKLSSITKAPDSKVILLLDDEDLLLPYYPYGYSSNLDAQTGKTRVVSKGRTALHLAAIDGNITDSTPNLNQDINKQDSNGRTPLYLSVLYGNISSVVFLLDKGANSNTPDSDGMTPLSLAANNGNLSIMGLLIQKGADLNEKDSNGMTQLYRAVLNGNMAVVELLIQTGADLNEKDSNGWAPLYVAILSGNTDIVRLLIQSGANVNEKDFYGQTLLQLAAGNGHTDIVRLLIQNGANVNEKDSLGRTPLQLAAENGHVDIVKLLIQNDADVKIKVSQIMLPLGAKHCFNLPLLHWATQNGHMSVVQMLIECDANVNEKDSLGRTPLQLAAENGHVDIAKLLINNGADISVRIKVIVFEIMLSFDAKPCSNPNPPLLHWATQNGHKDIVELLIQKGANVNEKDHLDQTPLQLAEQNDHKAIAWLIKAVQQNPSLQLRYRFLNTSRSVSFGKDEASALSGFKRS
jgi:ankyrin repeat protein